MKLTIGMIVKNEEKYLEKCLESIKPILDNVDSELIITDTGSTDRTVEIAKKYTDKVQFFEWINDFSAARNTTIEPAKGEWYLVVDADDVFESCDDIIHFFNSGEYKNYHCASFIYRNILDLEKYRYNDQIVLRMTEITTETRYVGAIHENLTPLRSPVRMITDIVDHYGYLYNDTDNKESDKSDRNTKLLLKELENTNEDDVKYFYLHNYLFESLRMSSPEKAEEYLNTGLEKVINKRNSAAIPLVMNKVGVLFPRKDYSDLLELCDTYFNIIRSGEKHYTADAEMYASKALSLINLGRSEEAFSVFNNFFSAFALMKKEKANDVDKYTSSAVLASDPNYLNIVMKYIYCCVETKRLNELSEFLRKTDISAYSFDKTTVSSIVENEIALMSNIGYENAPDYYVHLDSYGKTVLRNSLCNILFVENGQREEIIKALRCFSSDDKKLSEKADIYEHYFIDKALSEDEIISFVKKFGMEGNHDLLCIMMQCGIDFTGLWTASDFDPVVCVKRCNDYISGFYESAESYDAQYIADVNDLPKAAKIYEYCMKCAVETSRGINGLIRVYAGIGRRYANTAGNNDKPPEIEAACCFAAAEEARKAGDHRSCFSEMKRAVAIYPNISPVITKYNSMITEEYQSASSGSFVNTEMNSLALQVKNNIRKLIGKGDYTSASKLIEEYRKIAPNDPEINELSNMIV